MTVGDIEDRRDRIDEALNVGGIVCFDAESGEVRNHDPGNNG